MLLAAGAEQYFPAAAGGVGFVVLSGGLFLMARQVVNLIRENRRCNRKLGILYNIVVENNLRIPGRFFDEVSRYVEEPIQEEEREKRRGRQT